MEPNHYIYLTTNKINGKRYIGRCSNRYAWHAGYLGSGKWLKMAVEKYGEENFERTVLEEIHGDLHEAVVAEETWIAYYNAKHDRSFYNLSENGGGFDQGDTHSEATKKQISESTSKSMKAKGREFYANRKQSGTGRAPSNKGKKFDKNSEEYKRIYGTRIYRPPHSSQTDADRTKQEWEAWLASGENSYKKFCRNHSCSKTQMKKYLDNGFQFVNK